MLPWNSNIGDNIAMPAAKKVFLLSVQVEMRFYTSSPCLTFSLFSLLCQTSQSFPTAHSPLQLFLYSSFLPPPLFLSPSPFLLSSVSVFPPTFSTLKSLYHFPIPFFHCLSPFALTHDYQRPIAVIKKENKLSSVHIFNVFIFGANIYTVKQLGETCHLYLKSRRRSK